MEYCTIEDIETQTSTLTLIQLTSDDGQEAVNRVVALEAVLYSSTLIDGYLRGRYSLPLNPRRNPKTYLDGFSTTARKALEKYYLCYNKKDIEKYFSLLMFDKQDPMKDERIKLKDEIFINIGSAGQKIVDYLTTLLTN